MKPLLLTAILLLTSCSNSIHSTILDVKANKNTSGTVKGEVIGISSDLPTDLILSNGQEHFYAGLDQPHKLKVGDLAKLDCEQLKVESFGDVEFLYSSHCKLAD